MLVMVPDPRTDGSFLHDSAVKYQHGTWPGGLTRVGQKFRQELTGPSIPHQRGQETGYETIHQPQAKSCFPSPQPHLPSGEPRASAEKGRELTREGCTWRGRRSAGSRRSEHHRGRACLRALSIQLPGPHKEGAPTAASSLAVANGAEAVFVSALNLFFSFYHGI